MRTTPASIATICRLPYIPQRNLGSRGNPFVPPTHAALPSTCPPCILRSASTLSGHGTSEGPGWYLHATFMALLGARCWSRSSTAHVRSTYVAHKWHLGSSGDARTSLFACRADLVSLTVMAQVSVSTFRLPHPCNPRQSHQICTRVSATCFAQIWITFPQKLRRWAAMNLLADSVQRYRCLIASFPLRQGH